VVKIPGKAVGHSPIVFGGITMRKSDEMPIGIQSLWREGQCLGVCRIGDTIPDAVADTVTLNPLDYEAVKKSMMEAPRRDRAREWAGRRRPFRNFDFKKMIRGKLNA
jgi:hypothetical protein